ncbi:MAG: hypothetical protein WBQ43_11070 [Terriglobales bacterium]
MKRFMLALAALAMFLTTATLPLMADGAPEPACTPQGCQMPPSN